MEDISRPFIELGIAKQVASGQSESGDAHVVKPLPDGILLAVFDGLGHGPEAAAAANLATATTEKNAQEPLRSVFKKCHDQLIGTRGVVMSVARINAQDGTLSWAGVGNVEGRLVRGNPKVSPDCEFLLLRSGLVGAQLPLFHVAIMPIFPGDLLVFATDGVYASSIADIVRSDPAQKIADTVLARHSKNADDALVLAARYTG